MTTSSFAPPGPGAWELDTAHMARPLTQFMIEVYPEAFKAGFREGAARYGLLLDHMDYQFVNRFAYSAPRPVGAPPAATAPPPKLLFQLLTLVHPEMRRRIKASDDAYARKLWREDLANWDMVAKPESVRVHMALVAVDLPSLSDEDLAGHLSECRNNLRAMITQHHRFTVPAAMPVGDYLAQAAEWTGKPHHELLSLLRGAAPVSAGESPEFAALVAALRNDAGARACLEDGTAPEVASALAAPEVVATLKARSGPVGPATQAYLAQVGYRIANGYDLGDPFLLELPETLVNMLRAATAPGAAGGAKPPAIADDGRLAAIRELVPAAHRAAFDGLLAEARHVSRLRDERGLFSDLWAAGLTRRALLEAGERLQRRGRLADARHMVEAGYEEAIALILGRGGPGADELAERMAYRTSKTTADAPEFLGATPGGPPPADWLPTPASRRLQKATEVVINGLFKVPAARTEGRRVAGLAVSPGIYEGTARLVTGPEAFDRLQPGDVLVTRTTGPSFNVVLPLLGAIVTDRGGLLSHPAIVAREYGVPAVVGTTDATAVIPDGARVRVDGTTGTVEVIG